MLQHWNTRGGSRQDPLKGRKRCRKTQICQTKKLLHRGEQSVGQRHSLHNEEIYFSFYKIQLIYQESLRNLKCSITKIIKLVFKWVSLK